MPHLLWWAGRVPPVNGQAVRIRLPGRLIQVRLDSGESVVLKESEPCASWQPITHCECIRSNAAIGLG